MAETEEGTILAAFKHCDQLGLEGGVIYGGDRLLTFTLGESVGGDGFNVRFEETDTSVHGTYQMINREFVRHLLKTHPGLCYINQEEDMGMENLRRAKESYYPASTLNKYAAHWQSTDRPPGPTEPTAPFASPFDHRECRLKSCV